MPSNKTKKCISGCKSLDQSICIKSPRCNYANGQTRKFCRLSPNFKMQKNTCKVIKRIKKKEAKKIIGKFIVERKRMGSKQSKPPSENPEKITRVASRKIIKFFKNTSEKRTTIYLKALCSDSGVCIAFGTHRNKITNFFDGFTNFRYVVTPIRSLGKPSANGFVKEIKYSKNDYTAYAVLKSASSSDSDNLVYEYIVGQFINKQCLYYPCFLETYGLYFYKNALKWQHVKSTSTTTTNILEQSLDIQYSVDYAKMCEKSKYAAILIQHLKDVTTLNDMVETSFDTICYDLIYILYQVYMPLAQLKNIFTHYDLHGDNVLLYEPIKGKHIEYHYHIGNGQTIVFNCPYIVKIIDYGRSFYKYKQSELNPPTIINPMDIYDKLCTEPKCSPDCGTDKGFEWMSTSLTQDNYFISSLLPNMSHDLRLLNYITNAIKQNKPKRANTLQEKTMYATITTQILDKLKYGQGIKGDDKKYGTNVNKTYGFPNSINNVVDAESALQDIIMNDPLASLLNERKYPPANKIGSMHIYVDGSPMSFEPVIR